MADSKFIITPKTDFGEEKSVTITIRIDSDLRDTYDEMAKLSGRSRNELIYMALHYAMDNSQFISTSDTLPLEQIHDEYKAYWIVNHPKGASPTAISDAFYLLNNPQIGVNFWWAYTSDENLLSARTAIQEYLEKNKNPKTATSRTNRYYKMERYHKSGVSKHPKSR